MGIIYISRSNKLMLTKSGNYLALRNGPNWVEERIGPKLCCPTVRVQLGTREHNNHYCITRFV